MVTSDVLVFHFRRQMLLFLSLAMSLCSISVGSPWYASLKSKSSDYPAQLYCGVVARGSIKIGSIDTPHVDPQGFIQGIQEIFRQDAPHLNKEELNWIKKEVWLLLKDSILRKIGGIKESLLGILVNLRKLKTNKIKTVTLAGLLEKAEKNLVTFDPQVKSKTLEYLNSLPVSPDILCENTRSSLINFVSSPVLVPDFRKSQDIKNAILKNLKVFFDKDEKYLIIGYYALAQWAEYFKQKSPDTERRLLVALKLLSDHYRINFYNTRKHINKTSDFRVILANIYNNIPLGFEESRKVYKYLNLNTDDRLALKYFEPDLKNAEPLSTMVNHILTGKIPNSAQMVEAINKDQRLKILCPSMEKLLALLQEKKP
jgi:hypothetical protein